MSSPPLRTESDRVDVTLADIRAAAQRIASHVHRTPLLTSRLIDREALCSLSFKSENLQRGGAFKARGAHNAVLALAPAQRERGVATHSSGNHAAALTMAAASVGIPAYVVMPDNTPATKVAAVEAYGGHITFCAPTLAAREAALTALCERTGACFIPSYDHPAVVAGQGTTALEIAEQLTEPPDFLIIPVGGGGLLAGCAVAADSLLPDTRVIGAEPAGADDARRSLLSGERQPQPAPDTVADGLRTALGELNFRLISRHVDDILTVDDEAIVAAMRLLWTRMKLVVEASGAVGLAAVLSHPDRFRGARVTCVLSGGNVDLDRLPW